MEDQVRRGAKSYTIEFKLEAVRFAEQNSKKKAAEKFNVARSRIQQWVLQKEQLLLCDSGSKRLKGAGRPLKDGELDAEVLKFVQFLRAGGIHVTDSVIKKYAISIGPPDFRGSRGWLQKFKDRHDLTEKGEQGPSPRCGSPSDGRR